MSDNITSRMNMLDPKGLTRKLIVFVLPVLACGVVQQSFNAVDIAVVGKYVGHEALAAVGSNGPVIALIVNLFMGLSLGANVVIANFIGQRNSKGVKRAVATSAALSVICGIGMTVIGLIIARSILEILDTPAEVIDKATDYLMIFSLGFPGMMVLNFGSAILRSVGDTKRPFYCLVAGGLVNVSLNLIFVLVLGMKVEGVAIATSISNYVSAACIVYILIKEKGDIHLDIKELKLWRNELGKIIRIGLPAGIQGMVFAFSNVFIQSGINSFGHETVSGSAAALTYEFYCYFVIVAFTQATIAFIGQNYGARQFDMCRKVFNRCMILCVAACGLLNFVIVTFHPQAIAIFTNDPQVASLAAVRICGVLSFQFIAATYEIAGGALRALEHSVLPMVITIVGTCLLRIVWCSSKCWDNFAELLTIYPITWVLTGCAMIIAYYVVARKTLR